MPIDHSYSDAMARFRVTPTLNCLDENVEIFGQDTTRFKAIDLNLIPSSKWNVTGNVTEKVIKDYLEMSRIILLHNKPYFDQNKYGEQSIVE